MINPNWPTGLEDMTNKDIDRRQIIDYYRYWTTEAIKADLDTKRFPINLLLENFAYDFNIASAIRNANAFTVGKVWIVGRRSYDRRGCVGTHLYENIEREDSVDSVIEQCRKANYRVVVADNIEGAVPLDTYDWDLNTLLIMGQESIGVSQKAIDLADDVVYIRQRGSTRSLNVATATGIMLYDYSTKMER